MSKIWRLVLLLTCIMLVGCSTTGNLGIVAKSSADPASLLKNSQGYEDLGPAEGQACRHFILAIIPFGQSDMTKAVDKALAASGEMPYSMSQQKAACTVSFPFITSIRLPVPRSKEPPSNLNRVLR